MANAEPIRLGIAGLGRAGWGMQCQELESRTDMFRIVAVCDTIKERREEVSEYLGCKAYEKIEDLIADPDVEMVNIATRSCDHFQHGRMALEAGKDVFMEKPMCCTYSEAVVLKEIAGKSSRNLYVRHNRRFEPGFQHIREIMASGILGHVYEIKLRRVSYSRRADWQTIKKYGGGQLLNWGTHVIDHGLLFLDSRLEVIWSDLKLVAAVGDAEDHLKIILTGANGRIVDLEISGGAAISEPEYLIWGTKGALMCKGNTITLRYLDPKVALEQREPDHGAPGKSFGTSERLPRVGKSVEVKPSKKVDIPMIWGDLYKTVREDFERLPWVEESVEVNPDRKADMSMIWDDLYKTVREGVDFPIKLDEAVQVMKVVSAAKKGTEFEV